MCTIVALVVMNSPWAQTYAHVWEIKIGFTAGTFTLYKSLLHWINDGLMTIFFFVIGLEIKHELVEGELRETRKAILPTAAALGGMIVPAATYLLLLGNQEGQSGWGIPMATDIAFVVGFVALLGRRVPSSLRVLLLALAIVDDIGAVLVIAIFYTDTIAWIPLSLAGGGIGLVFLLRRWNVRPVEIYVIVGSAIWLAMVRSGVHPTVAGVVLGLITPAKPLYDDNALSSRIDRLFEKFRQVTSQDSEERRKTLQTLGRTAEEGISPLDRLFARLNYWVAYAIIPLFALANAGVRLDAASGFHPVAWAVGLSLVVGKPVGIILFSWIAVQSGAAKLPQGVDWLKLVGGAFLAGIGFTMSLFICGLALEGDLLEAGKIGTLTGSLMSAILGVLCLVAFGGQGKEKDGNETNQQTT